MCIVRHLPPASNYFIKAAALSLAWNVILWNDVDMEIPTFIKTRPSILGESQIFRLWPLKNIHPWNLFTSEIYSPLKFIHPEKYLPVKKYFSLKNIHSWKIFPPEKYSSQKNIHPWKLVALKNIHPWKIFLIKKCDPKNVKPLKPKKWPKMAAYETKMAKMHFGKLRNHLPRPEIEK